MEVKLEALGNGKQHRENRSVGSIGETENESVGNFEETGNRSGWRLRGNGSVGWTPALSVVSLFSCWCGVSVRVRVWVRVSVWVYLVWHLSVWLLVNYVVVSVLK